MDKSCYVYEWVRLDTNEPFYVGIGEKNRWKEYRKGRRNKKFDIIFKHNKCAVHILHTNLSREIAGQFESWYINEYKYIIGYDICNITDGGEGATIMGKDNPKSRKVICIETKKVYDTLKQAQNENNINYSQISMACNGIRPHAGYDHNGNKLHWMYYNDYLKNNCVYMTKYEKKKRKCPKFFLKNKRNTSGYIGVGFRKDRNKWRAYFGENGKSKSLGVYDTYEEALEARIKWESSVNKGE